MTRPCRLNESSGRGLFTVKRAMGEKNIVITRAGHTAVKGSLRGIANSCNAIMKELIDVLEPGGRRLPWARYRKMRSITIIEIAE